MSRISIWPALTSAVRDEPESRRDRSEVPEGGLVMVFQSFNGLFHILSLQVIFLLFFFFFFFFLNPIYGHMEGGALC